MSVSIKVGTEVHIWDRALTGDEVNSAAALLQRGEPILNCDCSICTGKTALAPWWLSSNPVVAFQATEGWTFDGMTVQQAQDVILSRGE